MYRSTLAWIGAQREGKLIRVMDIVRVAHKLQFGCLLLYSWNKPLYWWARRAVCCSLIDLCHTSRNLGHFPNLIIQNIQPWMFLGAHCYLTNSFLLMAGYMGYVHCNVPYPCMNILVYARLQHKTVISQLVLFNGGPWVLNVLKTAMSSLGTGLKIRLGLMN